MNRIKLVVAAATLLPSLAMAQSSTAWQFEAALYGYFPSMGGSTNFPSGGAGGGGSGSDISVDARTIIDNLKMVFMGTFGARNGNWGAFTDVLYMDLGNSKSQSRELTVGGAELPADVTADVKLGLTGTIWTLAGTYRALSTPEGTVDLLAGARMLDVTTRLDWQLNGNIASIPLPGRGGSREVSGRNWDAIAGLRGRAMFGAERRWFLPYYVDVGAGDSKLTWQAMGGVGYSYAWGDIIGAWRYIDYQMKSGAPTQSLNFNGPLVAVNFRW